MPKTKRTPRKAGATMIATNGPGTDPNAPIDPLVADHNRLALAAETRKIDAGKRAKRLERLNRIRDRMENADDDSPSSPSSNELKESRRAERKQRRERKAKQKEEEETYPRIGDEYQAVLPELFTAEQKVADRAKHDRRAKKYWRPAPTSLQIQPLALQELIADQQMRDADSEEAAANGYSPIIEQLFHGPAPVDNFWLDEAHSDSGSDTREYEALSGQDSDCVIVWTRSPLRRKSLRKAGE